MNRSLLLVLCFTAACGGRPGAPQPTPAERAAADTARATLIAALFDEPITSLQAVKGILPQGTNPSAVVVAFVVDSMGIPDSASVTIVRIRGDSKLPRNTCKVLPQNRFVPPGKGGPFLNLAVFTTFSPPMPTDFAELPEQSRKQLQEMTTVQRRDFLLDKGCRRFR